MSKFALLGDLHMGTKNDDPWLEDVILTFCKWFTEDCKKKGIKYCLQAGDWFDIRKGVSQRTMQFVREEIIPMFQETFDETYVIVGNHDMKMKEFITPNSCREILSKYDKFTVIEDPETIMVEGVCVDMIPWMCKSNRQQIMDFVKKSKSPYCMGHWELTGYYFYKGLKSTGDSPDFLDKYKEVWSGHFHTISNGGNVQYLGTPYTITLGDANDPRGYWVYDTDEDSISFCHNPVTNHHRVYFDADTWAMKEKEIVALYTNKVVNLVIEKSSSDTNKKVKLDRVLDDFERTCHEFSYKYVEEISGSVADSDKEDVDIKSTSDIIDEEITILEESDEVKDRIRKIFNGLLTEAISE